MEHVHAGLPATLILEGADDTVTPLEGVQLFHDRMKAHGNHCELYIYDGVGHLFTPNYLPDNRWPRPDEAIQAQAFNQADTFLRSQGFIQ